MRCLPMPGASRTRRRGSASWRRAWPDSPPAQSIPQQIPEEQQVEPGVTRTQAPRFRGQPEQPGQPDALHPQRRVGLEAGVDIEGKADREDDPAADEVLM